MSVAALIHVCYVHVSNQVKIDLRKLFCKLCLDDTPMVHFEYSSVNRRSVELQHNLLESLPLLHFLRVVMLMG